MGCGWQLYTHYVDRNSHGKEDGHISPTGGGSVRHVIRVASSCLCMRPCGHLHAIWFIYSASHWEKIRRRGGKCDHLVVATHTPATHMPHMSFFRFYWRLPWERPWVSRIKSCTSPLDSFLLSWFVWSQFPELSWNILNIGAVETASISSDGLIATWKFRLLLWPFLRLDDSKAKRTPLTEISCQSDPPKEFNSSENDPILAHPVHPCIKKKRLMCESQRSLSRHLSETWIHPRTGSGLKRTWSFWM